MSDNPSSIATRHRLAEQFLEYEQKLRQDRAIARQEYRLNRRVDIKLFLTVGVLIGWSCCALFFWALLR